MIKSVKFRYFSYLCYLYLPVSTIMTLSLSFLFSSLVSYPAFSSRSILSFSLLLAPASSFLFLFRLLILLFLLRFRHFLLDLNFSTVWVALLFISPYLFLLISYQDFGTAFSSCSILFYYIHLAFNSYLYLSVLKSFIASYYLNTPI